MPDPAFVATERQFLGLLDAGAGTVLTEVSRYSFEALPRGPRIGAVLEGEYLPLEHLWDSSPDLVVVTGCEPRATQIEAEPYWAESLRLLEWAEGRSTAILMSCLSGHFALYAYDGLERVRKPAKCTGVFPQDIAPDSPLTAGMTAPALAPHSRLNDVPLDAVRDAGYEVALSHPDVGWTAITGTRRGCDVLLLQGHPEYDPHSLLREYRRDANRYLSGERDTLPVLPLHCVGPDDWPELEAFHERVCTGPRAASVIEAFDFEAAGHRAPWPWRPTAITLYRNWVRQVMGRRRPAAHETR
jgi:homoserine O-succinyltransferase/O-acetyltransferase